MLEQIEILNKQITEKQNEIDNFDVTDYFSESDYKDYLNDEIVSVLGHTFNAGDVIYEMDYTAFRCGYLDYCDGQNKEEYSEYNDLLAELEELETERDSLQEESDAESE